jgi:outer membrane protein OmpA-like peptidoglycan-associated protein
MYKVCQKIRLVFKALTVLVVVTLSGPLFAQTADKIEALLNSPAINWPTAAQFVLEASEKAVIADPAAAFHFAAEKNWLPQKAVPEGVARLDGISLLLIEAFDIKGGLMYSLIKNPHYAYRELVYRDIIQGITDPAMAVSGEELLFLVSKLLSIKEAEDDTLRGVAANNVQGQSTQGAANNAQGMNAQGAANSVQGQSAQVPANNVQGTNAQVRANNAQGMSAQGTEFGAMNNLPNIQFMMNSAALTASAIEMLEEESRILKTVPTRNILVAGHVARAGTREEQWRTSMDRALAVANYLIAHGVRTRDEITIRAYGADRPIADNSPEEEMAKNRRVEIKILTPEAMRNLE